MGASSLLALLGFTAACVLAAMTGAFSGRVNGTSAWKKPSWRPPNRLFAPVWTVLYVIIAVSGWLVWREAGFTGAALPMAVYAFQLVLNAAWTPLFFGLHRPDLGFVDIVLVWLSIIATIALFWPTRGSRVTARALLRLGYVRDSAQSCDLASESVAGVRPIAS